MRDHPRPLAALLTLPCLTRCSLASRAARVGQGLSHGDLYTLAGVLAIDILGGPAVKWRAGRADQGPESIPDAGRLPAADKGTPENTAAHLRDIFGRMGFNDQEIVALSGGTSILARATY